MLVLGGKPGRGTAPSGRSSRRRSTMDGAAVRGRHLTLSHSLVSARCTPTSSPGFSRSRRAASGNHGPGTMTLVVVRTPRLYASMVATLMPCAGGHVVALHDQANLRRRPRGRDRGQEEGAERSSARDHRQRISRILMLRNQTSSPCSWRAMWPLAWTPKPSQVANLLLAKRSL